MDEIVQTLGHSGMVQNRVFRIMAPRAEMITHDGMPISPFMGAHSIFSLQPIKDRQAAVAIEFCLLPTEVPVVIKTLREQKILVTAVLNHLMLEQPRLIFVHAWVVGDPVQIVQTLQAALSQTNSSP